MKPYSKGPRKMKIRKSDSKKNKKSKKVRIKKY